MSLQGAGTFGCVFGVAEYVPGGRPGTFTWQPSDCEECEAGNLQFTWCNYNYRICVSCWNVIAAQLWNHLLRNTNQHAADLIWAYLLEPAQH